MKIDNKLQTIKKTLYLIEKNGILKLPKILLLVILISILELISVSLVGPYIAIISTPGEVPVLFREIKWLEDLKFDNESILIYASIFLLLVFFIKSIISIWTNYIVLNFSNHARVKLQGKLMHSYQSMPHIDYLERNSSSYIHSIQVLADRFSNGVLLSSIRVASEVIIVTTILTLLAFTDFYAFLLLSGLMGLVLIIYDLIFRKKIFEYGIKANTAETSMLKGLNEGIEGLKEVRILGCQRYFLDKVRDGAREYGDCYVKSTIASIAPKYILEVVLIIFVVLLVLLSNKSESILPVLGVFGVAAMRLLPSVNTISSGIIQFRFSKDSVSRLYKDIKKLDNEYKLPLASEAKIKEDFNSLNLSHVSFRYPGSSKYILNNISIEVNKGELIGSMGNSGSGKTTLIDLMLGLLKAQKGELLFNKKSLMKCMYSWRGNIAYLPQQIFIIDETIKNNIALGEKNVDEERVRLAIKKSNLGDFVNQLPKGLETLIGEKGVKISGGQRQRIALARAFYHDRQVLFMDESTSALDSETEYEVVKEIKSLKGSKTVIVIAHRLNTLQYCDRVYRLSNGSIEAGVIDENCIFKKI